jgi:hypothetical protein
VITFTVAPDEGDKFEVQATTRDILAWERTTKGASLKKLMDELQLADLYKVAYLAAKRNRLYDGNQAEFEDSHDLEFELDEEADPTQSAR